MFSLGSYKGVTKVLVQSTTFEIIFSIKNTNFQKFIFKWKILVGASLDQTRGVHRSVRVGFVPNPKPIQFHSVADRRTNHRPILPTGRIKLDFSWVELFRSKPREQW